MLAQCTARESKNYVGRQHSGRGGKYVYIYREKRYIAQCIPSKCKYNRWQSHLEKTEKGGKQCKKGTVNLSKYSRRQGQKKRYRISLSISNKYPEFLLKSILFLTAISKLLQYSPFISYYQYTSCTIYPCPTIYYYISNTACPCPCSSYYISNTTCLCFLIFYNRSIAVHVCLCLFVRLGQVRLGQVRLGQVRLGQVRLGQVHHQYSPVLSFPHI